MTKAGLKLMDLREREREVRILLFSATILTKNEQRAKKSKLKTNGSVCHFALSGRVIRGR